ncbi:universal stress protein [Actinokineospora sp. 24-640]
MTRTDLDVVAGFDGSQRSGAAVEWAAVEAAARGVPLVVVRMLEPWWPVSGYPMTEAREFGFDIARLRAEAQRDLTAQADAVRARHPDLAVTTRLDVGPVAQRLAQFAGEHAGLLVIGSSGLGGAAVTLLGSTAVALLRSPVVPTVLVRGVATEGGRVVVGVDGSPASGQAVRFAFQHAARHRAEVVVVHAWSDRPVEGAVSTLFSAMGDYRPAEAAERLVEDQLREATRKHPGVSAHRVHRQDRPARALVEAAEGACLLVVGSHGRGALGKLAFGSVSHAVVQQAPCPVAVVGGRGETVDPHPRRE